MNITAIKISVITSLYKGISFLEPFLQNIIEIFNISEVELIIIHNDPFEEEKDIINKYADKIPHLIYREVPLEGLYASWNRAIQLANGEYLAMWSVDDRRIPGSLQKQAEVLDNDEDCMMVTGNYYKVFNYGDTKGYLKKDPAKRNIFNKVPKFNNGCFLMWRKSVHEKVGYFDEQFKVAGDWEFWCRVTYYYKVKSCNTVLGYFLRLNNEGLSKRDPAGNSIENQVVSIRYYNFYITNIYKMFKAKTIKPFEIKNFNTYKKLSANNSRVLLTVIPSVFFFWMLNFKRLAVRLKYTLKKYKINEKEVIKTNN